MVLRLQLVLTVCNVYDGDGERWGAEMLDVYTTVLGFWGRALDKLAFMLLTYHILILVIMHTIELCPLIMWTSYTQATVVGHSCTVEPMNMESIKAHWCCVGCGLDSTLDFTREKNIYLLLFLKAYVQRWLNNWSGDMMLYLSRVEGLFKCLYNSLISLWLISLLSHHGPTTFFRLRKGQSFFSR